MNNKIVRISAFCVLMSAVLCATKETTSTPNELNEVVISDSKFALAKEKSGKVIVKLRLRNCQEIRSISCYFKYGCRC
jgi:vitamin B12 transporter